MLLLRLRTIIVNRMVCAGTCDRDMSLLTVPRAGNTGANSAFKFLYTTLSPSFQCYVFVGLWTASFLIFLSSTIAIHLSYHTQIISDCLVSFSLSLIPTIVNRPSHYQVAFLLSLYRWLLSYHVRYIDPQSGGTVGLGLCSLRSFTLTCSESSRSI